MIIIIDCHLGPQNLFWGEYCFQGWHNLWNDETFKWSQRQRKLRLQLYTMESHFFVLFEYCIGNNV